MKTTLTALFFLLAACLRADDILLADSKDSYPGERFLWRVTTQQIERLPEWEKERPPPLSPERAEMIAREWVGRQSLAGEIPENPSLVSLVAFPGQSRRKYFYKVHFTKDDGRDNFWTVHVLMDGSVVEPVNKAL